ncbi:MAG TPA: MarR family winged helix-turn-helix transcriptional regulator [Casimicrobiaceae bacterium]|nr:MarR family winged helix-turn-helix transcriptional regulator [Casimicrobiaceae bacterium]
MLDVACYCTQSRRIARALTDAYDDALAPSGLKVTQFSLLRMVARLETPTIGAVSEAAGLDRSTLGRNLMVMRKDGWVTLSAGVDERTRVVTLTKAGRSAVQRALPLWEGAQAEIKAKLPRAIRDALAAAPALLRT